MITQDKPKAQVSTQEFQRRQFTAAEMVMLRDYEIAAAVLSWDNFSFDTPAQITPADITNIGFNRDIVWYQIRDRGSIPIHIETFFSHWKHIQECSHKEEPSCPPPANKTGVEFGAKKYGQPSTKQKASLHIPDSQIKADRIFPASPPIAGDSVSVKLLQQVKAFATMAEWEEARNLIPAGYRIENGWFYDSHGGRCNLPPVKLSPRQIDILMGAVRVR